MTKQYHYVYLTTNLINGKQYVGEHTTNKINDAYCGSGHLLIKAYKKYGKHNFKREILEQFNSKKDAFIAQEKYINEYRTLAPYGYNISPKGGHDIKGSVSEETKKKISEHRSGIDPWNKGKKYSCPKISEALKGKPGLKGERNGMFGKGFLIEKEKNPFFGKHHSEQNKQNWSQIRKGIKFSKEHKEHLSESRVGTKNPLYGKLGKDNPNFGSKRSEETKQKMREKWIQRKLNKIS